MPQASVVKVSADSSSLYLSASVRAIEARLAGLPLMQRAGAAAAELSRRLAPNPASAVLILAGPGNNGGDGFVVASELRQAGYAVTLVFAGSAAKLPADAAQARAAFLAAGGKESASIPAQPPQTAQTGGASSGWRLIVDALLGIGLTRELAAPYRELAAAANALANDATCPLLALDCPSGLSADSGQRLGAICIEASHTITFIAVKPGLLTNDGPDCCGELYLAGIGAAANELMPPDGSTAGRSDFARHLRPRRRNSHKGTNGSAGVIGGAPAMQGAAILAGRAALGLGAGRVYLGMIAATPLGFDPAQPELMLRPPADLLADENGAAPIALTALACGPGMGQGTAQRALLAQAIGRPIPLLLDADAINLLAADQALANAFSARRAPSLLTPHPAEAARLLACTTPEIQADRIGAAQRIARRFNAEVVLKGCGSILASPDGSWQINTSGNPGMGSAGMGDVLSGIVLALLAQGLPAKTALAAGVHLHGCAADQLASTIGETGLSASETITSARAIFNRWQQESAV